MTMSARQVGRFLSLMTVTVWLHSRVCLSQHFQHCFEDPSLATQLNCSGLNQVIHITEGFSFRAASNLNQCIPSAGLAGTACLQNREMWTLHLKTHCNKKAACHPYNTSQPPFPTCQDTMEQSYLFVKYQCLHKPSVIWPLCQNNSPSEIDNNTFIASQDYPDLWISNPSCGCSLSASNQSRVAVTVLEFSHNKSTRALGLTCPYQLTIGSQPSVCANNTLAHTQVWVTIPARGKVDITLHNKSTLAGVGVRLWLGVHSPDLGENVIFIQCGRNYTQWGGVEPGNHFPGQNFTNKTIAQGNSTHTELPPGDKNGSLPVAVIIGAALGSAVVILIIVVVVLLTKRHRSSKHTEDVHESPYSVHYNSKLVGLTPEMLRQEHHVSHATPTVVPVKKVQPYAFTNVTNTDFISRSLESLNTLDSFPDKADQDIQYAHIDHEASLGGHVALATRDKNYNMSTAEQHATAGYDFPSVQLMGPNHCTTNTDQSGTDTHTYIQSLYATPQKPNMVVL